MKAKMTDALDELFSARQLKRDPDTLARWGCDWTRSFAVAPGAVVFVESIEDVQKLTRTAAREGIALVPSGGRTGLSGGAVAGNGEVVVSFDRMNRILGFDPADRLVSCQAGVVTQSLQEFAQSKNLSYPVDFASAGSSQIGGNIATNAGGIKVIRYGLTRDWVAGLTVVTGTGELLTLSDVFRDVDAGLLAVSGLAAQTILSDMGEMADAQWVTDGTAPEPVNFQFWALADDALRVFFPPYQVGPYAMGPQVVDIPLSDLYDLLAPRWQASGR